MAYNNFSMKKIGLQHQKIWLINQKNDHFLTNPIFSSKKLQIGLSWSKLIGFAYFFLQKCSKLNKEQYYVALIIVIAYYRFCEQFCPKKWSFLTTNVFWLIEKNLLVKLSIFIADSERAIKVVLPGFKSAEQTSFKSY